MSEQLQNEIIEHLQSDQYRPQRPRKLARDLDAHHEERYSDFRCALRELMHQGRVALGAGGTIILPNQQERKDVFVGTYRAKKGGFGFVTDTAAS